MKSGKKISQNKLAAITLELRRLGVAFEHNNDKISLVAEMVEDLAKNMEIVKEDIEFIKNNVRKKVDVEEFSALARRVSILERRR